MSNLRLKCTRDCKQGRACVCEALDLPPIEVEHPWLYLLYALAAVFAIALSSLFPWGVQP